MTNDEAELWRAIWRYIDRRRSYLGLSWRQLEKLGKVSQRTFYKMRDDGTPLQSAAKRASLARALQLQPDALDLLEKGEEPAQAASPAHGPATRAEVDASAVKVLETSSEMLWSFMDTSSNVLDQLYEQLNSRIGALEELTRSQAQDIAYLLDRARQDDLDAPLAGDEPTGDAPQPGSAGV